ncbi:hypothetical protein KCP71_23085 [Salmonella enterica subsp. enterica]|nr:hypothetical protein KCP71_23085 [Salmonella enterica subsp. enterica]
MYKADRIISVRAPPGLKSILSTGRRRKRARQSAKRCAGRSRSSTARAVEHDGKRWLQPDIGIIYPDRDRRRPPGTTSKVDFRERIPTPARFERWLLLRLSWQPPACLTATSSSVIRGMRHTVPKLKSIRYNTTKCSIFRTFRGWTALDMLPGQGCFMSSLSRRRYVYSAAPAAG